MFDSKLHSTFQNFLVKQSGGNIINIRSFTIQTQPTSYNCDFNKVFTSDRKLIIECTCRNSNYFPGIENLNDRFIIFFKNHLKEFSYVELHYHYSMYYCRD
jgi:hypothetical protein